MADLTIKRTANQGKELAQFWPFSWVHFLDTHFELNPSALVGYIAKKRFICVSVICGKASFPDQRIDLELLSAGRRRVSFSAPGKGFGEIWSLFSCASFHRIPAGRPAEGDSVTIKTLLAKLAHKDPTLA